jgi:hypothetical protein
MVLLYWYITKHGQRNIKNGFPCQYQSPTAPYPLNTNAIQTLGQQHRYQCSKQCPYNKQIQINEFGHPMLLFLASIKKKPNSMKLLKSFL